MQDRRSYLKTLAAAGLTASIAGCQSGGSETTTNEPLQNPGNAQFEFRYKPDQQQVEIQFTGGVRPQASNLQIQHSDGTQVKWHELGSTVAGSGETLSKGATAVLGPNIINWNVPVKEGETIRLVYVGKDAPATLGRFTPEGTTTLTTTIPPTATRTTTETTATRTTTGTTATRTDTADVPSITAFSIANPSSQNVRVSFNSDEQLSSIQVDISNAETATLTKSDFTEATNNGSYNYEATYNGGSNGTYTATLQQALDQDGNDGANGTSVSVTVAHEKYDEYSRHKELRVTTADDSPSIDKVQPIYLTSGDETTTGNGAVTVDWENIAGPSDIAVYDENSTLLDYTIEELDTTNETGLIWVYNKWVRDGTVQAQVVYGDGPEDQQASEATVWDQETGIRMRYNFAEASGQAKDSTSKNNNSIDSSGTQYEKDGQFGSGRGFENDGDYVQPPDGMIEDVSDTTYYIWVKLNSIDSNQYDAARIFDLRGDHYLRIQLDDTGTITSTVYDGDTGHEVTSSTILETDTWYLLCHKYDHSDAGQELFIDNNSEGTTSGHAKAQDINQSSNIMNNGGGSGGFNNFPADGIADQAVIHQDLKSQDWIDAEYDASAKAGQVFFSQKEAESI